MLAAVGSPSRRTLMKPETLGMSSARLARLDEVMKHRYVDGGDLPGMLTHVYRKGHLAHTGMCGHMDIERDKLMREDAIFRIYSMSKPITAVALMMLVEEGRIGLDDAVHSHIPAWSNLGVYASGTPSLLADAPPSFMTTPTLRPMKVIDLATHTSGLTYGFMMRSADDARESPYATPPELESGGGGLVSTAHDYLRFCRMMLNGGTLDGVQILSPKTVALFSLNYLPEGKEVFDMALPGMFSESSYAGVGFSLGCGVNVDVAKTRLPGSLGEFFWGGAAATAFWIDPKEELTVVFMTQVIGSEARLTLRRDLRTLVYSSMTESFA